MHLGTPPAPHPQRKDAVPYQLTRDKLFPDRAVRNPLEFEREPSQNRPPSLGRGSHQHHYDWQKKGGEGRGNSGGNEGGPNYLSLPGQDQRTVWHGEFASEGSINRARGRMIRKEETNGGAYHAWPCLLKASGLEPSFMDAIPESGERRAGSRASEERSLDGSGLGRVGRSTEGPGGRRHAQPPNHRPTPIQQSSSSRPWLACLQGLGPCLPLSQLNSSSLQNQKRRGRDAMQGPAFEFWAPT